MLKEATRAWIYRVLTAANPLLIFYGVVEEQAAPLWTALFGAALGTGLAVANTTTKKADVSDE